MVIKNYSFSFTINPLATSTNNLKQQKFSALVAHRLTCLTSSMDRGKVDMVAPSGHRVDNASCTVDICSKGSKVKVHVHLCSKRFNKIFKGKDTTERHILFFIQVAYKLVYDFV